jgi:hypothetical protein
MSRVILFIIVLALPLSESLARQDVACSAIREEIEAKDTLGTLLSSVHYLLSSWKGRNGGRPSIFQ